MRRSTGWVASKSTETRPIDWPLQANERISWREDGSAPTITSRTSRRIRMATAALEGVGCPSNRRS